MYLTIGEIEINILQLCINFIVNVRRINAYITATGKKTKKKLCAKD